jgi:hypothetical protein
MPIYTFRRIEDGQEVKKRLSFAVFQKVRVGELSLTDTDGEPLELLFRPGTTQLVMKDGLSGGWASKTGKERTYRARRRKEMERRQRDHVHTPGLIPNYNGAEAPSWRDAQEEARKEKGDVAAASYESKVLKENRGVS